MQPQDGLGFVNEERTLAQDQIAAAWQLHVEQVQEQLERGWRENVGRALDERFQSLSARFEEELESRVNARVAEELDRACTAAERAVSERLNQTSRRLEQAEDAGAWASALLDGAGAFADRAVLFSVINDELQYEDHRAAGELDLNCLLDVRTPLADAPAFASVLETKDAVIAMATPGELSQGIADAFGSQEDKRVMLLPVIVGQSEESPRVAGVLYAEGGAKPLDVNLLEVVTAMAGLALDASQTAARAKTAAPAGALMSIAPAMPGSVPAVAPAPGPDWGQMPREEQELHAKAQRFARVRVAEMRLYQAQAVRQGREQSRLYMALRGEMDRGRAQFKHEFLHVPSMIDYFHQELVRTLANDDASLLGPEYPGPLV